MAFCFAQTNRFQLSLIRVVRTAEEQPDYLCHGFFLKSYFDCIGRIAVAIEPGKNKAKNRRPIYAKRGPSDTRTRSEAGVTQAGRAMQEILS